ncbi:MAG: archease [Candidatus Micrarchaeaceae archaeon]
MLHYRYKNHTADIEFNAYGKSINELFDSSALALFNIVAYSSKLKKSKSEGKSMVLHVHAKNYEELLWRSLQLLLSTADAKRIFFYGSSTKVKKGKSGFSATIKAYYKPGSYEYAKLEAKGISKYMLYIKRAKGRFASNVVVDV